VPGTQTDSRAESVLRRQGQFEGDRATFESHWSEIAERVLPRQRDFNTKRTGGEKLTEKVFDSTAPLALERFAAAMESMLTPRTQRWHELKAPEALKDDETVKRYLHEVTSVLFRQRYAPAANFASQAHEAYMSLGAFGSGAVFVDDHVGRGLRYRAVSLAELYFAENFQGIVDTVHRRFELSARQAAQQFGADNLPATMAKSLENEPDRKFEFIHCVKPREDAAWDRLDYKGMAYASYYVSYEGRKLLREGGYRTMRYAVSRYVTAPREVYGRSPAMTVLADIKTVNEMQKTLLRTGQLIAEPPILLTDDGSLGPFKLRPGGLNYGALAGDGTPLAQPFAVGANLPITLEMVERQRKVLNDAFLVTLFQILVEQPQMTATEAMLRAQEKGALLAPTMGRQQSEMLGPLIQAEIDILQQAGIVPPAPDALHEAGGDVQIEYVSPLTRAQRADEGVGILRTIEQATALSEFDPDALLAIKADETIRELGEINGMPSKLMRTPDEIEALKQARAQQQQMASALAAAPVVASAAKDMAQAQALAGGAPSQMAPAILGAQ
jgi:hypothetical protein